MFDARWPFRGPESGPAPNPAGDRAPDRDVASLDVVCVGHALVDHLAHASADEVAAACIEPGAMLLVDSDRALEIDRAVPHWQQAAGGSAANTAAGVALLGGRPAFAGGVGDDKLGRWYA
ncbi:MAG: PfkB family carbohydrate kinase, partial [Acidimicrobiales bacterium]